MGLLAAGASLHRQVENLGLPHTLCCILKHVGAWELLHVSPALAVHENNKEIKRSPTGVISLCKEDIVSLHVPYAPLPAGRFDVLGGALKYGDDGA